MARAHDPNAVIAEVLARFKDKGEPHVGRSRAALVLESGLAPLDPALTDGSFMVTATDNLTSFERRREVLSGRVLLTRNSAEYIDDAPVLGMGMIGLDALGGDIHVGPTLPDSATAVMISKAFIDFDLGEQRGAYMLLLHPGRRHVFRRMS